MEDSLMFDLPKNRSAAIKVIGVGGGGSNAVNYMYQQGINGVDFVVCNTDAQALNNSPIPNKVQLGVSITEGMGAGANPEIGEQAALESLEDMKTILDSSTKMVFITAGMGGGTGTGAAPVIAGLAKDLGILTVGICTIPFTFEGKMRLGQAQEGVEKLRDNVDSLIVINNNKLRELYGNLGYKTGFAKADEVLATAAKGIAEVITHHYATNIDLRDAKTVLANSGTAIMGSARASGENKAKEAIVNALDSPLLNNNKITGAKNVLLLIVSDQNEITIDEIGEINDYIQSEAGNTANIIMGIGEDDSLGEDISITIVATGFPMDDQKFTGKEEQKIFHRLEDEQALTQELSPKMSSKPKKIKQLKLEEDEAEEQEPFLSFNLEDDLKEKENEDSYELFDRSESNQEINLTNPNEPLNVIEDSESEDEKIVYDFPEEETEEPEELDFEQEEEVEQGSLIFRLDDDDSKEELEIEKPKETKKKINKASNLSLNFEEFTEPELTDDANQAPEVQEEVENPFNKPISNALSIQERSKRLKQFNFKFKQSLTENQIDETERIPAFERTGVELDEESNASDLMVSDKENEVKIRPNNYLNKNVD